MKPKRRSSLRPVALPPLPSPRTWPVVVPIFSWGEPRLLGPLGHGKRMDQPSREIAGPGGGALRRRFARIAGEVRGRGPKGGKAVREGRGALSAAAQRCSQAYHRASATN